MIKWHKNIYCIAIPKKFGSNLSWTIWHNYVNFGKIMDLISKLQISMLQMLLGNVKVSPSQLRAVWVCSSQSARWVTHGSHDHPAWRSTNLDEQSLNWDFFHRVHVHLLTTMISLVLFTFFFKKFFFALNFDLTYLLSPSCLTLT